MFALVFLIFVASASTSPWYDPYDYNNYGFEHKMERFWNNFNRKMNNLGKDIEDAVERSKIQESRTKIEGDEYKITIYLIGFNKEDIVVKIKEGNLVIQAIHNVPGEPVNNYLDVRGLPDYVDENGSWSYNDGVLTIVFPITQRGNNDTSESTLPYVNNGYDKPKENNNSRDGVTKGHFENSYNNDRLETASAPGEYDYEEAL